MKFITKIGRGALLAIVILGFVGVANAQTNSNVLTVPLQFSVTESLTLSVTSGSPQVFPSAGGAATSPLVIGVAWNFAQARHVTVFPYLTTNTALTGTNLGGTIAGSYLTSTSSGGGVTTDQGFSCNLATSSLPANFPGEVTPTGIVSGSICPAIFNGAEASGQGSGSTSVVFNLDLTGAISGNPAIRPLPDSYTGSLLIVGAYL
jgi:hypothetical protein